VLDDGNAFGAAMLVKPCLKTCRVVLPDKIINGLDAASSSFADGGWVDVELGNLLFPGTNGEGARNLADAFARWKADGGKYITTGLSGKLDPEKYATFAKIVSAYRQSLKSQPDEE